jgi:L-ascorbate metabolism protein UlaG (beta-lactamase superfamily)
MKITWFGHSAFRVDIAGAAIMIDPFLENGTYDGDIKAAYRGATHVVLTHGHDDHLGSTLDICQETGALLVANWEICHYYAGKGVENYSPAITAERSISALSGCPSSMRGIHRPRSSTICRFILETRPA